MTKKIIGLLIVMSVLLSSLPIYASSTDKAKPQFTRNTVITESNFNNVLVSVGIDPVTCIGGKANFVGITTVGQLQDELEKVKKMPKVINLKSNCSNSTTTIGSSNGTSAVVTPRILITGSVYLTSDSSFGTTTTISQTVRGDYSKNVTAGTKVWTGVGNPSVTLTNLNAPYVLSGYELEGVFVNEATYTSSMITMDYNAFVLYYVIILGVKVYPGNRQEVSGYATFNTDRIP